MVFSESERIYAECQHESPHTLGGTPITSEDGDQHFYKDGRLHRRGELPAVQLASGYRAWYINGMRHNETAPARQWANGHEEWFVNDECHRDDDKPAITMPNGYLAWYKRGKRHRDKGPARISKYSEWWVDGVFVRGDM